MISKPKGISEKRKFVGRGHGRIGRLFRIFRRGYGLTLREMGECIHISPNYVYMIETGRALPSLRVLRRFAAHFGFNFQLIRLILLRDKLNQYKSELTKKFDL
ncbi:MAG: helix-turn-helix transcriptional regulator [Desulfobacterales bacterium]|nr:helix-turn-helix transcriptional regulator [Desulfobacterales bacterium]